MAAAADYPFEFRCRRSGNCCAIPGGFVRVGDADVERIAAYLDLTAAAFRSRYVTADGERLVDGLGSRCVFLQDGAQAACSIYAARPAKCRDWPFWPELLTDPELLRLVQRTCPGITSRQSQ